MDILDFLQNWQFLEWRIIIMALSFGHFELME